MEVYTEPPPDSYLLNKPFKVSIKGTAYSVYALPKDDVSFVLAAYTIIIHFLFAFLWQIVSGVLVGLLSAKTRTEIVGLIALWNAPDPWTALLSTTSHVKGLLWRLKECRQQASGYVSAPTADRQSSSEVVRVRGSDLNRPLAMLVLSAFLFSLSIGISIKYAEWLQVGNLAPVQPEKLYLPLFDGDDENLSHKLGAAMRPSIMRAFGSAEAVESNSKRQSYSFDYDMDLEEAKYSYTISGADFGLQTHFDLEHKVKGSCKTNYDSIRSSTKFGVPDAADEYNLFDGKWAFLVPGENYPELPYLQLNAFPNGANNHSMRENTFALLIESACLASSTASSDPWYETEPVSNIPEDLQPLYSNLNAPFRVKPRRPIVICTQTTEYCYKGRCYSLQELGDTKIIPEGISYILAWHLGTPKLFFLTQFLSAFGLRAYIGSNRGQKIDAAGASLEKDIDRLVMGAYLASKEAFRDTALMTKLDNVPNVLRDDRENLRPGSAAFSLRPGNAIALRLDLLVLAPTLLAILAGVVGGCKILRNRNNFSRFTRRQDALAATQLFRMMDEKHDPESNIWDGEHANVPIPIRQSPHVHPYIAVGTGGLPPRTRPLIEWSDRRTRRRQNSPVMNQDPITSAPPTTSSSSTPLLSPSFTGVASLAPSIGSMENGPGNTAEHSSVALSLLDPQGSVRLIPRKPIR